MKYHMRLRIILFWSGVGLRNDRRCSLSLWLLLEHLWVVPDWCIPRETWHWHLFVSGWVSWIGIEMRSLHMWWLDVDQHIYWHRGSQGDLEYRIGRNWFRCGSSTRCQWVTWNHTAFRWPCELTGTYFKPILIPFASGDSIRCGWISLHRCSSSLTDVSLSCDFCWWGVILTVW